MDSREVCVWLDRRWYDALSRHLEKEGMTVEEKLDEYLDAMIGQLPEQEREEISREIREEEQRQRQEAEAVRQLAVFHVREDGRDAYFQFDQPLNILTAAKYLRNYLRGEAGMDRPSFAECCERHLRITAGEFDRLAGVHMRHPQKVTGAYELDFDRQEFSSAHPTEGWQTYPMKDVSAAAYYAFRPDSIGWPERMRRLTDKLAGKETASAGHLSARQVTFAGEISEIEGKLDFYIDTGFDVDAVFGTQVCTGENDDCLNVYADYDMAAGQVCGELAVDLHWADGREEAVPYTLNAVEKAMLLSKMEAYCLEQTGMTLTDYSAQLMAENLETSQHTVRPLSVFRVTQDGRTDHLLAEGDVAMDALHTALRLRTYLIEKGDSSQRFAEVLPAVDHIAPEVFRDYADELRQNTGRVTAALDVNLDRGTFSALAGAEGWQTYTVSDVCLAAWQATLPDQAEWEERRSIFAEHLQDKLVEQEIPGMVQPSGPVM